MEYGWCEWVVVCGDWGLVFCLDMKGMVVVGVFVFVVIGVVGGEV